MCRVKPQPTPSRKPKPNLSGAAAQALRTIALLFFFASAHTASRQRLAGSRRAQAGARRPPAGPNGQLAAWVGGACVQGDQRAAAVGGRSAIFPLLDSAFCRVRPPSAWLGRVMETAAAPKQSSSMNGPINSIQSKSILDRVGRLSEAAAANAGCQKERTNAHKRNNQSTQHKQTKKQTGDLSRRAGERAGGRTSWQFGISVEETEAVGAHAPTLAVDSSASVRPGELKASTFARIAWRSRSVCSHRRRLSYVL